MVYLFLLIYSLLTKSMRPIRVLKKDLVVATSRLVHIIASIRQWDELFFLLQPWRGVFFSFFPLSIENRCRPKLELDLVRERAWKKGLANQPPCEISISELRMPAGLGII